ncbi:PBSX family phage terminase large subunit [Salinisphaera hydrothermalis]|uniref:Phage terminase, large subunit n=1 Tax=Salinisphaera hydrothermalis (strain C41B8) TaxID=1304275 RepID=A0A084INP0_SALHC|nr:PBSX family phage terminase large subunit [Salinisphaera hydrothermalis]KEZ78324.1 phage terminase, large subunit [Salinisphaera hydrothermalis C41B8]
MTGAPPIVIDLDLPEIYDFLLERRARYKCAYGGRGAGRSWSFAQALLILGIERPGLRVLCAREHQKSIADSVHRLLRDQIDRLGLQAFYRVTDKSIDGPGGTSFLFAGLRHNISNIKSMEGIDIVWIEEAERVSENSWRVLVPTIRKEGSEIWVTFNPDQETDPTYQRLVVHPPRDAIVRKTSWRDNPHFPVELARERDHDWATDPEAAAHIWDGECRQHNDAQVLNKKWRVDSFEPVTAGEEAWDGPYYGADWGFAQDPTALVRFWIAPGSKPDRTRLMIEYEAWEIGCDLDDTPALFDEVPGAGDYLVRADSARPETISYMRKRDYRVEGAPKWHGSVEDGIAWLRGHEEIVIHSRCKHAAQEARFWSYKIDKQTDDVLPILKDGHDHVWDAVRYGASPMIRNMGSSQQGILVRSEWWRQWPREEPPRCEAILQFLYPALGDGEAHHASARTTWGIFRHGERWDDRLREFVRSDDPNDVSYHCILLERWSDEATFPELRESAKAAVTQYDPDWLFVPRSRHTESLIRELRQAKLPVRGVDTREDSVARMHYASIVPQQARAWYIDRNWSHDVIGRVAEFPETEHVGIAETCSMAWAWLRRRNEIGFADEQDEDDDADLFKPARPYG